MIAALVEGSESPVIVRGTRGQTLVFPSAMGGNIFDYFIPARLSELEISGSNVQHPAASAVPESTQALFPLLAVVASRGRELNAGRDAIEETHRVKRFIDTLSPRSLDLDQLRRLHASMMGGAPTTISAFRTTMTWVSGSTPATAELVPPPASAIAPLMADWIAFLRRSDVSGMVRIALLYYQWLMIHPFRDGNGRLARLLMMVLGQRLLSSPTHGVMIAAVLTRHRHAMIPLYRCVRNGDPTGYLAYWSRLLDWSGHYVDRCVADYVHARRALLDQLPVRAESHRLAKLFMTRPAIEADHVRGQVSVAKRTLSDLLGSLVERGTLVAEDDGLDGKGRFQCPIAWDYWKRQWRLFETEANALLTATSESMIQADP